MSRGERPSGYDGMTAPEFVTPEWVALRVFDIKARSSLDHMDLPHFMEDELRAIVLQSIADQSCVDPESCAKTAMLTEQLDFVRWYV